LLLEPMMGRFIEGETRSQSVLFPERLEDWIADDNPVRAVDAFVDELDLAALGFVGAEPADTGRPAYHPAVLLKIYIYGYLNRIPSSRRLEREAQRNVELMWLTRRLAPDFKTIADFRRDNGTGIRNVCRRFVLLCRDLKLFSQAIVAVDSSKFKAVNSRDGRWFDGADLLEQRLSTLPHPRPVHDLTVPSNPALGARRDSRGHAAALGSAAAGDDAAQAYHRACVWHAEALDGFNPLP
jgi:transposase